MKRTYVRADLTLTGSWRIGSWDSDAANIQGTLRDQDNNPEVPGSGIAGMLRAAFGDTASTHLGRTPDDATADKNREISPWWILGTVTMVEPNGAEPAVAARRRTRIDRRRKAAAKHGLFDTEEVKGGKVTIYFRADDVEPEPFLELLTACIPRIGGGRTIGLGTAELTGIRHRTIEFSDQSDDNAKNAFKEFLQPGSPIERVERLLKKGRAHLFTSPGRDPLLTANLSVAKLAITDRHETRMHGSTMKGILRSRVEFIGRSMGHLVCGEDENNWTGCGHCGVCALFGYSGKPGKLEFMTADIRTQAPDAQSPASKKRVRIAIDRFTGGTRSGAWFQQQYVENVTWPLTIYGSLPAEDEPHGWIRAAILHALHDIDDGLVAIGPEGAAGYGHAQVENVQLGRQGINLGDLPAVPVPFEITLADSAMGATP